MIGGFHALDVKKYPQGFAFPLHTSGIVN